MGFSVFLAGGAIGKDAVRFSQDRRSLCVAAVKGNGHLTPIHALFGDFLFNDIDHKSKN
jgi:hypothetical protein